MQDAHHGQIENVCLKASYVAGAFIAGVTISCVAIWWAIFAH